MTAPAHLIYRDDRTVIQARQVASNCLMFVAIDLLSGLAVLPPPSREECASVMPFGWVLYPAPGSTWRARPMAL